MKRLSNLYFIYIPPKFLIINIESEIEEVLYYFN